MKENMKMRNPWGRRYVTPSGYGYESEQTPWGRRYVTPRWELEMEMGMLGTAIRNAQLCCDT